MSDKPVLPFVGLAAGLTLAAVLLNEVYPEYSQQILVVLIIALVVGTVLLATSETGPSQTVTSPFGLALKTVPLLVLFLGVAAAVYVFDLQLGFRIGALILGLTILEIAVVAFLTFVRPPFEQVSDMAPSHDGNLIHSLVRLPERVALARKYWERF